MDKFKVGDKVRVVKPHDGLPADRILTVAEVDAVGWVRVDTDADSRGACWKPERFEHVLPDAEADGYNWPTIAGEAESLVYGDRNDGYGHPRRNFTRIAHMWTALLSDKLAEGEFVDGDDVGRMMVALKLSRDVNAPKRDNRVDAIGYLIAMDRLETGK